MSDRSGVHVFSQRDGVAVIALGSSVGEVMPELRERLRTIAASRPALRCVVVDTAGAGDVEPSLLAAELAEAKPENVSVAVVCPQASPGALGETARVDGVVVVPSVRQALEACQDAVDAGG